MLVIPKYRNNNQSPTLTGVKNFVQHGKAQLPEEETIDPENMFTNRRRAPAGPKREPGEGMATELPKNSEYLALNVFIVLDLLQLRSLAQYLNTV